MLLRRLGWALVLLYAYSTQALPSAKSVHGHCGGGVQCHDLMLSVVSTPGVLVPGEDAKIVIQPQFPPTQEHRATIHADDFVQVDSSDVVFAAGSIQRVELRIQARSPHVGGVKLYDNDGRLLLESTVTVVHARWLDTVCTIIGWLYFAAWSISFYPQVIHNYKKKSVVGLNFDFVYLNLMGWVCYSAYNFGLYCVASVRAEYQAMHPGGDVPVKPNDLFFALHALVLTLITIYQTTIYEYGEQSVSVPVRLKLVVLTLAILALLLLALFKVVAVLTALTWLSFIKLGITIVKYMPQAHMNYRRKSTEGWSIGNVLLDFTGGILSMLQMLLIAWNTDDFSGFVGNPTKFGLGLFSVMFDVLFMAQHYIWYRPRPAKEAPDECDPLLQKPQAG